MELTRVPTNVPIVSKILNSIFDIENVIIVEFVVNPGIGSRSVSISFNLESDREFDLADFIIVER